MKKEMKEIPKIIEEFKEKWDHYEKWENFPWRWWKPEDKVHWPRFDGKGEAKGPYITFSGRHNVERPEIEKLARMINNTWLNNFFMLWKIMRDELGREKANEIIGYHWLTQITPTVNLIEGLGLEEKDRDCVTLSKIYQEECYIECCDLDVVEEAPERFQVRMLCNWWRLILERWKAQGIAYDDLEHCELCLLWCEYFGRAIHPKIACTLTEHPLETGNYCELVFEMEDGR